MRRLSYIVSVPLAIILVVFAVSNRDALVINFWPLPWAVALPGFAALFLALLIGFLAGAGAVWLSGGKARRRARSLAQTARAQAHQISEHERRHAESRSGQGGAAALPPPRN